MSSCVERNYDIMLLLLEGFAV